MNPLRPSSSNDIARAGRRAFDDNEDQHFYRRLYDSSPLETTGSSTLRLALSEPNTESNLTNMDRFSAGSSTQFQAYDNNHDPSGSSESYRFHAAGPHNGSRRPNNDNNADMSFLNQRWIHSSDLIHSLSLSDKSASQTMDPPSRMPDQHSTPIHQPPASVMAADNTLDVNKTKKKHGCWMCHKSFDRPRYAVYSFAK